LVAGEIVSRNHYRGPKSRDTISLHNKWLHILTWNFDPLRSKDGGDVSPNSSPSPPISPATTSRPAAAAVASPPINDVLVNPSRYVAINYIAKLSVVDLGMPFNSFAAKASFFVYFRQNAQMQHFNDLFHLLHTCRSPPG